MGLFLMDKRMGKEEGNKGGRGRLVAESSFLTSLYWQGKKPTASASPNCLPQPVLEELFCSLKPTSSREKREIWLGTTTNAWGEARSTQLALDFLFFRKLLDWSGAK